VGLMLPRAAQIIWPLATLVLGAACGCAAFSQEQRSLSCQFLASQHLPLRLVWRTKITLWSAVAGATVIGMLVVFAVMHAIMSGPGVVVIPDGFNVPLCWQMGTVQFFGVWLVYGFCLGQVFVWYFRKTILAILMTFLVAGAAVIVWMPS